MAIPIKDNHDQDLRAIEHAHAQNLRAIDHANKVAAPGRFRELTEEFALRDLKLALDAVLAHLRDGNRPQAALNLSFALRAYLDFNARIEPRATAATAVASGLT